MKITQDVREYAATLGVSDDDALKVGMEEKSRQFVDRGAEVYQRT